MGDTIRPYLPPGSTEDGEDEKIGWKSAGVGLGVLVSMGAAYMFASMAAKSSGYSELGVSELRRRCLLLQCASVGLVAMITIMMAEAVLFMVKTMKPQRKSFGMPGARPLPGPSKASSSGSRSVERHAKRD